MLFILRIAQKRNTGHRTIHIYTKLKFRHLETHIRIVLVCAPSSLIQIRNSPCSTVRSTIWMVQISLWTASMKTRFVQIIHLTLSGHVRFIGSLRTCIGTHSASTTALLQTSGMILPMKRASWLWTNLPSLAAAPTAVLWKPLNRKCTPGWMSVVTTLLWLFGIFRTRLQTIRSLVKPFSPYAIMIFKTVPGITVGRTRKAIQILVNAIRTCFWTILLHSPIWILSPIRKWRAVIRIPGVMKTPRF